MTRTVARAILVPALLLVTTVSADDEAKKLVTIEARDIKLQVPASWEQVRATSKFRAAQFRIPNSKADAEAAELVVYHFGGPTGGIKANIQRWVDQFHEDNRKVDLVKNKWHDGSYFLADVSGTWKKPDGPPFAQKTIDKPGSRVIGVVLVVEKEDTKDYYFLKLSGPDGLVKSQAPALRTAFEADAKSEKPFKLEDADN
jgi:hypothetical protein